MNGMLQTFTTMVLVLQADCFGTHPVSPPSDETFDYIIVGSGPGGAGALLGLIEHDPSANILLLERGKNLLSPSPSGGVLAATTGATADFVASEGATTFKDIDNVIIVESNTLGGLAAMNVGMWHHMPADYVASKPPNGDAHFDAAAWARAAQNTSKACTTYADDDASSHGAAITSKTSVIGEADLGNLDSANAEYAALDVAKALPLPLGITRYPFSDVCSQHDEFFKATLTTSTQAVAGNNLGVVPPVARVMHSHSVAADAEGGGVQVRTESEVVKVLLDGGRATGVMLANGQHLHATKMTLLCAGVYATPSLLAKSGLGPESWYEAPPDHDSELQARLNTIGTKIWQSPDMQSMIVPMKHSEGFQGTTMQASKYKNRDLSSQKCGALPCPFTYVVTPLYVPCLHRVGTRPGPISSTLYSAGALRAPSTPTFHRAMNPGRCFCWPPASASAAIPRYPCLWGRFPRSTSSSRGRLHWSTVLRALPILSSPTSVSQFLTAPRLRTPSGCHWPPWP
jgi:hypothetical protein